MILHKTFLFSLVFAFLTLSDISLVNSQTLPDSVALLMKTSPKDIELKKQRKGSTPAGNYSFQLNDKKYIVKVFAKRQNSESRQKEIEAVKIFSNLGIGAKFVASNSDNSFYVREFVQGKTLKYENLQNDETLVTLAKALRKLHAYECEFASKNQLNRAEKHYARIIKKKIATPSFFGDSYENYKKHSDSLAIKPGFCHNDLNPHNIIVSDNGSISFINLENCGNSNTYEELGYVTMLNGIFGEKLETFLKTYFDSDPTQDDLNAVKLSQKLVSFLTSLGYFDFSESKKDKDIEIKTRIKTLDDLLDSDALKSAVEFIKEDKYISVKSRQKDLVKQYALAFYENFLEK